MTRIQKIVIIALAGVALLILGGLVCSAAFFFFGSSRQPDGQAQAVAQPIPAPPSSVEPATPTPALTPIPEPSPTPEASTTPEPTPTATLVVTVTVPASPTPTRAHCEDTINNFEASGVISNEEVKAYLRRTLPHEHLDNCREIRYVPLAAAAHGTAISGSFIPVYREIFVYSHPASLNGVDDLLDTLVHEVGHNVHYNIRRDNFDLDVTWSALHQASFKSAQETGLGFVSTYAQTNKFEDFAETYMAYVRYPDVLKTYNFDKYSFMKDEVFNGFEYAP